MLVGADGKGSEQIYMGKRLVSYLIPVFWLLMDDKVMLYLKVQIEKNIRIYTFR